MFLILKCEVKGPILIFLIIDCYSTVIAVFFGWVVFLVFFVFGLVSVCKLSFKYFLLLES